MRVRREGGSEASSKSGYRFGCARRGREFSTAGFSVKEKDETSHPAVPGGLTFIRRFVGV